MEAEIVEAKFGSVPFSFALLQFHPNPWDQEFVNVAVALHAPRLGFLGVRAGEVAAHVRDLFPLVDPEDVRREIEAVEAVLLRTDPERISSGDLRELVDNVLPVNSRLRWSSIETGLTPDAREKLNELCERLVDRERPSAGLVSP